MFIVLNKINHNNIYKIFVLHIVNCVLICVNVFLQVDDNVVKKKLPGRFFELNIHFGIFLGGQGDFSELFLGHMENFRGCMEDVS